MLAEGLLTARERTFRPNHRPLCNTLRLRWLLGAGSRQTTHLVVRAFGLGLALIQATLRVQTSAYLDESYSKSKADAGNPLKLLVSALGL
jgi:hypothetical protein